MAAFLAPGAALPEVAIQLGWVVGLWLAVAFTWNRGIRRYGAYGA